jgi:DNA-binding transcriptional LysR family regulator
VELKLEELGRDEQLDALAQNEIEVAIIRGFGKPLLSSDLTATCLIEESMVLALRKDHPLATRDLDPTIADLRDEPLVLYSAAAGAGFNEHFFWLCEQAAVQPRVAHEANGLATLLGLVAAGFGATILAESLVRLHVDNLVYRQFSPPLETRLWLVHHAQLSPTARNFVELVQRSNAVEDAAA